MSGDDGTRALAVAADVTAPDGSEVRLLAAGTSGSMAHFTLAPGAVSKAIVHCTVEELWFIMGGSGRMWRKAVDRETVIELRAGVSLLIPTGVSFQFRCDGDEPMQAVGVTMPPWPGPWEALYVEGPWKS
jgi:mannose-6-phosphate isomerase-like protein (cupin superfamily)